jgi:protein-S-isoprenylcysteine O-methyltransferase Ste14
MCNTRRNNKMYENIINDYIFKLVFVIWMISEIILYLITVYKSSGTKIDKKSSDRGSAIIIALGVTLSITISIMLKKQSTWFLPNICFYIGTIFMLIGIIFRCCAVFTLKQYFSYTVVIKNEHHIVKRGLYKYLRHPAYTGFILILIGIPLCLKLLTATLLVSVIALAIFSFRIYVEEKKLLMTFGDDYRAYSDHTWRIIPFIW